MRKALLIAMAAALLVAMVGPATADPADKTAGDAVGVSRSVSGGTAGQTLVEDPFGYAPFPIGTYFPLQGSFLVVELPNGQVNGHMHGTFLGAPPDFKADVICVSFDDNQAWLGLELRKSPWPFPDEFGIWVEDNGQGAKGEPDRISSASFVMGFFGTAQEWCDLQPTELTEWEIDNGNILVSS